MKQDSTLQRVLVGFKPDESPAPLTRQDDPAREAQIEQQLREAGLLVVPGVILSADGRCWLHLHFLVLRREVG